MYTITVEQPITIGLLGFRLPTQLNAGLGLAQWGKWQGTQKWPLGLGVSNQINNSEGLELEVMEVVI